MMYFWNIEKLKAQIIERPLTDKETLPYLILTLALLTAIKYLPQHAEFNLWDYVLLFVEVTSIIAGTYWLFLKNKAEAGSHFLQRFFAIGWVASIRVIVFAIPVMILLAVILIFTNANWLFAEASTFADSLFYIVLALVIYWYNGKQIADVAEKAKY